MSQLDFISETKYCYAIFDSYLSFNKIKGENHYEIYQNTKHKTTAEKQKAMALLVALAGGAITETQMYDKGFRGKTTAIFNDDTMRIINNL